MNYTTMQETPSPSPSQPAATGVFPGLWTFLIVLVALIAIMFGLNELFDRFEKAGGRFSSATDFVAVVGPLLTAISTIAAAAFGVSVGTSAGQAAGKQAAASEKARADSVVAKSGAVNHEVSRVVNTLWPNGAGAANADANAFQQAHDDLVRIQGQLEVLSQS